MTIINQLTGAPIQDGGWFTFQNYGAVDIAANQVVIVDLAHGSDQGAPGIVLATVGGSIIGAIGITQEIVKAGRPGRVRVSGSLVATAQGAIQAGQGVAASNVVGRLGQATITNAAIWQLGVALSNANDGDPVEILVQASGAQRQSGTATLASGSVIVPVISLTASSAIVVAYRDTTNPGTLSVPVATRNTAAGTFVIHSSSGTDASTVDWAVHN